MQFLPVLRRLRLGEGLLEAVRTYLGGPISRWWHTMTKKKTLNVSLNAADYDHYQNLAQQDGLTLTDWVRRKLAVPALPSPVVIDEAFRRLDVSDSMRELTGTPPPPPPAPKPLPVVSMGETRSSDFHPCVHHVVTAQPRMPVRNVCTNRAQYGRPCHWPAAGSKDCMHFSPRG
jgi:hypothetical protein